MTQLIRQLSGIIQNNGEADAAAAAFIKEAEKAAKERSDLNTPLTELSCTVFDLETTGFYPYKQDRILSIGAVKVSDGEVVDQTFYSCVYYDKPISPEIQTLTGLTEQDVINAPAEADVLTDFFRFIGNDILVAHHAAHEKGFMQDAMWRSFRATFQRRLLDTVFLTRLYEPLKQTVNLEDCCKHFNISTDGRHNALSDARMTGELWIQTSEALSKSGIHTLKDVYRLLAR
ncbi:exonuclease domain-containing protein [Salisediminibacterium beveridgei]|nr:exonuclease domain-containing protein [Salisediminibacterium beveridgei]